MKLTVTSGKVGKVDPHRSTRFYLCVSTVKPCVTESELRVQGKVKLRKGQPPSCFVYVFPLASTLRKQISDTENKFMLGI